MVLHCVMSILTLPRGREVRCVYEMTDFIKFQLSFETLTISSILNYFTYVVLQ